MNIVELCSEYDRLEKERKILLREEAHGRVVDPEVFRKVADGLRNIHSEICIEVQASLSLPSANNMNANSTKVQSYFSAWQSLRLFRQQ
jgi:hypothetical protein